MKLFVFLLFICFLVTAKAQSYQPYSFYVAGHAYGSHNGENIGLHPPFLKHLTENRDSNVWAIFLTGDIVNKSNNSSWKQVEKELSEINQNSYYVMGNHDNNDIGYEVFNNKHGGTYYSIIKENELFIVLNSTESDRSISSAQLTFLENIFANTNLHWERAFIFFHEVIWNSNEKYKLVRSNSRSRYNKLVNISNFWDSVFPMLTSLPKKQFYLFAGDVGGNADAISASYDVWENITLLSSGMGEVADENYLKVIVLTDTVEFELVPLNNDIEMKPIDWYNIPDTPEAIVGPSVVNPLTLEVAYYVPPLFNATGYKWNLDDGISGNSDVSEIYLHFDNQFQSGKISVTAINDGFGESEAVKLEIHSGTSASISDYQVVENFKIYQNQNNINISFTSDRNEHARIIIYDVLGRTHLKDDFRVNTGLNFKSYQNNITWLKPAIVELKFGNYSIRQKIMF